ncbi:MAG: polyamine aminopropyltransferase [Deltaproteobacteria bacterium]|nr:MAG: polyamine aminopropyltransferase [Deltaproteobacteria bacterium]
MTDWYVENYRDEMTYGIAVKERIFDSQSDFQRVEIFEAVRFGRTLVIDGIFMTSERDEFLYHEMIVHPALCTAKSIARVLIIGGGDGGTAREVLRHPEVEKVLMVEIDGMVVDVCKKYMPALGAWDDPRLEVRIADGIAYMLDNDDPPWDVIILDGTDPVGPGEGLFNAAFYRTVKERLAPGGVFALQSESPILDDVFFEIQDTLREIFGHVHPYFGPVPLYSAGVWSWTYATDDADPMAIVDERATRVEAHSKTYNREMHRAAFALPQYAKKRPG